jgi:S-adenosylmethionine/arginine decarboxylase-like enzyme
MDTYGKELILDLHNCDTSVFNRTDLFRFFKDLCDIIDMEACDLHFWDDIDTPEEEKETEPHLVGTSAVQFIKTSNITVHTLDIMKRVYLNIFTCKDFDPDVATQFCQEFFQGEIKHRVEVDRI